MFLDSCTVQTIGGYGAFLFDNVELPHHVRMWSVSDGYRNLLALRAFLLVNQRANFELMVGESSWREAMERRNPRHTQWFFEIFSHSAAFAQLSGGFTRRSYQTSLRLEEPRFGYLSKKDREILKDALGLQCQAVLTMERRLPGNSPHMERELGLRVLTPTSYWDLLEPWAGLWL